MANIKSIGGNPIVLGLDGLSDEVTHGYNPSLSVGRADALTGADETAQWATRESTGSGAATVRSVQGAAVAWNQLNRNNGVANTTGLTRTFNSNGSVTIDGTSNATGEFVIGDSVQVYKDHKYLVKGCPAGGSSTTYYIGISVYVVDTGAGGIWTSGSNTFSHFKFIIKSEQTFDNVTFYPQLFDLTAMFGSGNEPATVEEFERMYPASYYPYSAPTLKPVQIAGIRSTTAQGGELDSVEWTAQTLWGAGTTGDVLYSDHKEINIGVVDLGTLTWSKTDDARIDVGYYFQAFNPQGIPSNTNKACAKYTVILDRLGLTNIIATYGASVDKILFSTSGGGAGFYIIDSTYTTAAEFKAAMSGVLMYFELATPTTQPISPALPMTYKVQQGGSESIIVPDGEVSAAPIITVAEGESAADVVMDALACIAAPDGPVATSNHAINTYLTMGGKLYKVTTAIASGEQIVSGTNVTETTVMAELLALAN